MSDGLWHSPSVLAARSVEASALKDVSVVLLVLSALLFVLTMGVLLAALRAVRKRPVPASWWVLGGGIGLPLVVLTPLLLYGTARTAGLEHSRAHPALTITVIGHLWWWEVRVHDPVSGTEVVLANELRLPVGRPTQIALRSADVIHSFWVPTLGGKRDLVPGRVNHLVVTPTQPGVQRGACAEYCGLQHAHMALHVVALPPDAFDAWLARERDAAAAPRTPQQQRGLQAFHDEGCAQCHTVRGLTAPSLQGPDLTHVARRTHLGAGTLRNEPGALQRWLIGVQQLKPGARMPSYAHLDPATLDALAAFLAADDRP